MSFLAHRAALSHHHRRGRRRPPPPAARMVGPVEPHRAGDALLVAGLAAALVGRLPPGRAVHGGRPPRRAARRPRALLHRGRRARPAPAAARHRRDRRPRRADRRRPVGEVAAAMVEAYQPARVRWDSWSLEEMAPDALALHLPVGPLLDREHRQSARPVLPSAGKPRGVALGRARGGAGARAGTGSPATTRCGSSRPMPGRPALCSRPSCRSTRGAGQASGEPGVLSDPAVLAFHRAAVPRLQASNLLRLSALSIDGAIVGAYLRPRPSRAGLRLPERLRSRARLRQPRHGAARPRHPARHRGGLPRVRLPARAGSLQIRLGRRRPLEHHAGRAERAGLRTARRRIPPGRTGTGAGMSDPGAALERCGPAARKVPSSDRPGSSDRPESRRWPPGAASGRR